MDNPADDICRRMEAVRRTAGEEVETIVRSARTLSDWRYYVKNHPFLLAGAAAGLGFLLIPKKKSPSPTFAPDDTRELIELLKKHHVSGVTLDGPPKGLLKTFAGLATPILLRTALNFAQSQMSSGADWRSVFGGRAAPPDIEAEQSFEEFNIPR